MHDEPNQWQRVDTHTTMRRRARGEQHIHTPTRPTHPQTCINRCTSIQQRPATTACTHGGSWYGGRTQACSTCSVALRRPRHDSVCSFSKSWQASLLNKNHDIVSEFFCEDCYPKLMVCDLKVCTILPSLCAKNYYHNYYAATPWCLAFHALSMSPLNWELTNLNEN